MKKFTLLVFFVLPFFVFSQNIQWLKTVGDIKTDYGQFVRTDSAGNIYVAGIGTGTDNFGHDTLNSATPYTFVAKYDSNGNNLWAVQYAYPLANPFTIYDFQVNSFGEAYMAGYQIYGGEEFGQIVKVNSNGTLGFQFQVPEPSNINTMDFDSHNNYRIVGDYNGTPQGFFAVFNSADSNLWNLNFATSITTNGVNSVGRITPDNGFLLISAFADTETISDIYGNGILLQTSDELSTDRFVAKYDSTGHLLWAKGYSDNIPAIQMTVNKDSGDFYLLEQDNNEKDYLSHFDAQGNEGWTNNQIGFGSPGTWRPHDLIIHDNNLYFIGGGEVITYTATLGIFKFNRYDLEGNLTGSVLNPYQSGNPLSLIGGGVAFIGNSMVLAGGFTGSGTWGNQTITGDGTDFSNIFVAKMNESNLNPATSITALTSVDFSVYPNPSSGEFFLRCESITNAEAQIIVTNMLGENVYRKSFLATDGALTSQINIGNVAPGLYLVTLISEGKMVNQKVVVN